MKVVGQVLLLTIFIALTATSPAVAQLLETKITASDAAAGDNFGGYVQINGDLAICGASKDELERGAAYIYELSGGVWSEIAKLTASDGAPGDLFGYTVAVSDIYALVGAWGDESNQGAAYLFERNGAAWTEVVKFTADDGNANDQFGRGIALDNDYAIVGAWAGDGETELAGAAYIYRRDGSDWNFSQKISTSGGAAGDGFGRFIDKSGDRIIFGAFGSDANATDGGAAYVFRIGADSLTWSQEAQLLAADGGPDDNLGFTVSIDGDYAVAGAEYTDDVGAAYVFHFNGADWIQQARINPALGGTNDRFGRTVAIDGNYLAAGADQAIDDETGYAYLYERVDETWAEVSYVLSSDATDGDRFGRTVSISGDHLLVGAWLDDDAGDGSGSAYLYTGFIEAPYSIDLEMDPQFDPVPAGGSRFRISMTLVNTSADLQTPDIWIDRVLPGGTIVPVLTPKSPTLQPGEVFTRSPGIQVPAADPSGEHTVVGYIGMFPDQVAGTDTISFTKLLSVEELNAVASLETVATSTGIFHNYPNPFNPSTEIQFSLEAGAAVRVQVFDITGRPVATLLNGILEAGVHRVAWNGCNENGLQAGSGVYIVQLEAANQRLNKRITLLR